MQSIHKEVLNFQTSQDFPKLSPLGLSIIQPPAPSPCSDENRVNSLVVENVDRRPRKRKAAVQPQGSPTQTLQKQQIPAAAVASPWKSSIRVPAGAQGGLAVQGNTPMKNVRFSNVQQQNLTLLYKTDSPKASSTMAELRKHPSATNKGNGDCAPVDAPAVKAPRTTTSTNRRKQRLVGRSSRAVEVNDAKTDSDTADVRFTSYHYRELILFSLCS